MIDLSDYEIRSLLGAGGMGEVHRAYDRRLGREVAIKRLPQAFTTDPERLARFEREARVLASLNHPNIAAIYAIEHTSPSPDQRSCALILELVEGQTLADRIALGPLKIAETVDIAIQIARALEAAHDSGIVHRDLKPANIKITPQGTVKVLDFGLATPPQPPHHHSPRSPPSRCSGAPFRGDAVERDRQLVRRSAAARAEVTVIADRKWAGTAPPTSLLTDRRRRHRRSPCRSTPRRQHR